MKTIPALALLALGLAPAVLPAQDLAAAAAKEQERRAHVTKDASPAPVITAEALAKGKGTVQVLSGPGTSGASSAPSREEPSSSSRGDEDSWRAQMTAAHDRVDAAQKRVDALHNEWFIPGSRGTAYLQRAMEQAEAELRAAQKAVTDLEDRARRASVPPGWLR